MYMQCRYRCISVIMLIAVNGRSRVNGVCICGCAGGVSVSVVLLWLILGR